MRWDIKFSAQLFLSAIFFGVGIMAAPEYLHLSGFLTALCFWVGFIGSIFFGVAGFVSAVRGGSPAANQGRGRKVVSFYGMIFCGLGFWVFAAIYFWPSTQTSSSALPLQTTEPVSLFFECDNDFLPASLPQTGRVWAIELAWNPEVPHQGGQNKEMFGQPGTPLVWFDDNDYRNPYRCEIRNYSTGAIFNIFLEFDVIFSSYIQVSDGGPVTGREGPMIAKAKTNIKISRLDIGPNNPFVFYIYNQSAYSVHLSMPNGVLVGADDFGRGGQTETITTNTTLPLYFAPRTKQPTGYPAGPLPPPTPPK